MAYNHGREDRKWRIWKEAEEKLLRECGVDEATIEQIRMADRADFNSNRRVYRWKNDGAEYLEDMAGRERQGGGGRPGPPQLRRRCAGTTWPAAWGRRTRSSTSRYTTAAGRATPPTTPG